MKYRKKSVEVEAIRYWSCGINSSVSNCIEFCGKNNAELEEIVIDNAPDLIIHTSNGNMRAMDGYWVIKGEDGEGGFQFWPVSDAYFKHHYEKVEE